MAMRFHDKLENTWYGTTNYSYTMYTICIPYIPHIPWLVVEPYPSEK